MNGNWGVEDLENEWSDAHLRHVFSWLLGNDLSPWKNAPTMLMTACELWKGHHGSLKSNLRGNGQLWLRRSDRQKITKNLKKVLAGEIVPEIEKRNKLGWVTHYALLIAKDPQPLPIPVFIKGTINITRGGVKIAFNAQPIAKQPRGDKSKLLNPFGV